MQALYIYHVLDIKRFGLMSTLASKVAILDVIRFILRSKSSPINVESLSLETGLLNAEVSLGLLLK